MKRRLLLVVTLLAGWNLLSAQSLPDRKETLKTLVKVNDYFMKKYADFTRPSYVGKFRPSNIWTRGVYYEGLMALHTVYPRSDYYDCVVAISHVMQMTTVADRHILNFIRFPLIRRK